jgi:hypothetical protein
LPDPSAGQYPALRFLSLANNTFTGGVGEGWQATGVFTLVSRRARHDALGGQSHSDNGASIRGSSTRMHVFH